MNAAPRAVVVMGRLPVSGRVKTRLCPPLAPEQASRVYAALLADVVSLVDSVAEQTQVVRCFSCALFEGERLEQARTLVSEGWQIFEQCGADLGERIAHAHRSANAECVAIIGSDAPTMRPGRLLEAFDILERGSADAVFGPTSDGGYDLIASRGLRPELLEEIPWSTSAVLETTQSRAAAAGIRLALLDEGYDVDNIDDLIRAKRDAEMLGALGQRTREVAAEVLALLREPD